MKVGEKTKIKQIDCFKWLLFQVKSKIVKKHFHLFLVVYRRFNLDQLKCLFSHLRYMYHRNTLKLNPNLILSLNCIKSNFKFNTKKSSLIFRFSVRIFIYFLVDLFVL